MAADQSRGHGQKQAEWRRPGTFRETCLARAERGQTGASPEQPVHGHPLLFMGARDRTEVRNLKRQWSAYYFSSSLLRSAGGRRGACICTVGAVRSGSLQKGRRLSCVWGEGRACFQAAAGTIQDVVADGPALHSRVHLVVRGLEFWLR